ncbi:hypothetical protein RB195_020996 [Necator americanus]|uniref:G-protein coupled receptors family 1 profile domain-containing protein n=1 Tax=Necator americanus TaxID=51031 RepID=A0ABR1CQ12_NECAM
MSTSMFPLTIVDMSFCHVVSNVMPLLTFVLCALTQLSILIPTMSMLFCSRLHRTKAGGSSSEDKGKDDMVLPPRVSFKENGEMVLDHRSEKSHRRSQRANGVSFQRSYSMLKIEEHLCSLFTTIN